jgi:uncharacterized protein YuzE
MQIWIECRSCEEEFDPDSPLHSSKGYRNQCFDCATEAGLDENITMGAVQYNEDGDIMGIELVDKKTFEKLKQIESATTGILSAR